LKNGLKPTLKQMKIMQLNKMDHTQWLVTKVMPDQLECVHRLTGDQKKAFYKVAMV
jgi:hypothetical protein